MPRRSRMAVLAIAAGLSTLALATRSVQADDPPPRNTVALQLLIAGLSPGESTIEIKPGHQACKFDAVTRTIAAGSGGGMLRLEPIRIEAESLGADRDCSFAITIREPGQEPRTFRRGIRLAGSEPGTEASAPVQTLKLYLSVPAIAAREPSGRPGR